MEINNLIDHTKLGPLVSKSDIEKLTSEAITYKFKSVCVSPTWVAYAAELLKNEKTLVCTVIGFPHGTHTTATKVFEAQDAIKNGADEIDTVVNISMVKARDEEGVYNDIRSVVEVAGNRTVKVIIETAYLTKEEIEFVSLQAVRAKATFVKTSTGYAERGASKEDVEIIKNVVKDNAQIKASGGVRSYEDAVAMIEAGATRIGTSNGVKLVNHEEATSGY